MNISVSTCLAHLRANHRVGALVLIGLLGASLSGCALRDAVSGDGSNGGPNSDVRDVVQTDASGDDASTEDASAEDASAEDASTEDASTEDALGPDSSAPDAQVPSDDVGQDATLDDVGDGADSQEEGDISEGPRGAIAMVGLPADFAMWVADTSAPIELAFEDGEGAPAPAPDEVVWSAAPDGLVELRRCDRDGCKVRALRPGQVQLTAAAPGFRSATVGLEVVGWHTVEAGMRTTCAINTRGALYCWGENTSGNLGQRDLQNQIQPTRVRPDLSWKTVRIGGAPTEDTGPAVCATTTAGELYCWGDNSFGRLGIDRTGQAWEPTKVSEREVQATWEQVSVGSTATCGRTDEQRIYCWGRGSAGELGVEPPVSEQGYPSEPVLRSGATSPDWRGVSVSYQTAYAWADIPSGANSYAWGYGFLGTGQSERSNTPKLINGPSFAKVVSGPQHRCGLTHGGAVQCWGSNRSGYLILDNGSPRLGCGGAPDYGLCAPISIALPGEEATDVSAGDMHTCAVIEVAQTHELRCWGANDYGQLGNGVSFPGDPNTITYPDASRVSGERDWAAVSAGARHTCGITQSRELFCWGELLNGRGSDGRWTFEVISSPTAVTNPAL